MALVFWLAACRAEKPPLTLDTADTAIVWSERTLRSRVEPVVAGLREGVRP